MRGREEGGRKGVLQHNSCSWRQKRKPYSTTQSSCWGSDHLSVISSTTVVSWMALFSLLSVYLLLLEEQEREHLVAEVQQRVDHLKKEQKKRDALEAKIKVS